MLLLRFYLRQNFSRPFLHSCYRDSRTACFYSLLIFILQIFLSLFFCFTFVKICFFSSLWKLKYYRRTPYFAIKKKISSPWVMRKTFQNHPWHKNIHKTYSNTGTHFFISNYGRTPYCAIMKTMSPPWDIRKTFLTAGRTFLFQIMEERYILLLWVRGMKFISW